MAELQKFMEKQPVAARHSPLPTRHSRYEVLSCARTSADRESLERFIQHAFQRNHGAVVRSFMPILIGLRDAAGNIVGAAGYRPADLEPLYLEQYLDDPVERAIATWVPEAAIARAQVAEIGNFACRDCATALAMVSELGRLLVARRHRWAVFTATRTVRAIMSRRGINLIELGPADPSRLLVTNDNWGAYYSADPRVMLGCVPDYCGEHDRSWSV